MLLFWTTTDRQKPAAVLVHWSPRAPQKFRKSHWCVPFTATFSKWRKIGASWSERCDSNRCAGDVHKAKNTKKPVFLARRTQHSSSTTRQQHHKAAGRTQQGSSSTRQQQHKAAAPQGKGAAPEGRGPAPQQQRHQRHHRQGRGQHQKTEEQQHKTVAPQGSGTTQAAGAAQWKVSPPGARQIEGCQVNGSNEQACYPKGWAATGFVQCQCNTWGLLSKLKEDPPLRKINVTSKSPVGDISVVTLIRTDTTLDHSQKAEKVCFVYRGSGSSLCSQSQKTNKHSLLASVETLVRELGAVLVLKQNK